MTLTDLARYGGAALVDLRVDEERAAELKARAVGWQSWTLTQRQSCDLELLACGGFTPLESFLGEQDYRSVCGQMRLADDTLWPIPVTLDVPGTVLGAMGPADALALRDDEGVMLAALWITEAWKADPREEAAQVFGSTDEAHPGVEHLVNRTNRWYVTGTLEVLNLPEHRDFRGLLLTPDELRGEFLRRGWQRIVAFQTRNPMHRAHQQLTLRAARDAGAKLLLHPVVGMGKPGDIDALTRVRCYQALLPTYPPGTALLSLLPLAMRMGGPREALWHAIIRRNYGATHFIVGRDHASPGVDSGGRAFYPPYGAQELLAHHAGELGLQIMPFRNMVYVPERDAYSAEDELPPGARAWSISGTEQRELLAKGRSLPSWFTPPAVADELRRSYPPLSERGFTVFFTGLSGAGKSTIAENLCARLRAAVGRRVTLLDGDVVRRQLSSDLGFSREERNRNVLRIGYVAAEITAHRGVAVCAPIAPYEGARREVRGMVESGGGFVLVYVSTPLDVCERRDRKGLYARVRAGMLPQFTGISDPYEVPTDADVVIDTTRQSVDAATEQIIEHLHRLGYLGVVEPVAGEQETGDLVLGAQR